MGNYNKDNAIAAQNAGTTAGNIFAALIAAGGVPAEWTQETADVYHAIRITVFNGTLALAGAEAIVSATESDEAPAESSSSSSSDDRKVDPSGVTVKFGKHRGKTLGQILSSDREYVEWLSAESNNDYMKRLATELLAA